MKPSSSSVFTAFRQIKLGFIVSSLVELLLGLVLLLAPNTSSRVLCTLVGMGVLVYGLFNVFSFVLERNNGSYTFELLIGIVASAFGLFSLINPGFLMSFLFLVLGLVVLVGSICSIRRALNLKSFGFHQWWMPMASACITFVIALTIIFYPALYGAMLMMVIGAMLVVEAVNDLFSIYRLSKFTQNR